MSARAELIESVVVGPWEKPERPMFICPPLPDEPDPCDCGFDGEWERRWVYIWHEKAGFQRSDIGCRRDIARGLPPRVRDEGWWVIKGRDERCPQCGDIERFDNDGHERIAVIVETVRENVVDWDAWRKVRSSGSPTAPDPTP